jgi:hypothetical protein
MGAEVSVSEPRGLENICRMYVRFFVLQFIIAPFSYLWNIFMPLVNYGQFILYFVISHSVPNITYN